MLIHVYAMPRTVYVATVFIVEHLSNGRCVSKDIICLYISEHVCHTTHYTRHTIHVNRPRRCQEAHTVGTTRSRQTIHAN